MAKRNKEKDKDWFALVGLDFLGWLQIYRMRQASIHRIFRTGNNSMEIESSNQSSEAYCSCQSEYCVCGSSLGVTETSALNVYRHLGFPSGRDALLSHDYRLSVLHVWGTHNISTEDVLSWLDDYSPVNLEWINDASCELWRVNCSNLCLFSAMFRHNNKLATLFVDGEADFQPIIARRRVNPAPPTPATLHTKGNVVLPDEATALRVILDFAEPFDRRVALAAAAALMTAIESRQEPWQPTGQPHLGTTGAGMAPTSREVSEEAETFNSYSSAATSASLSENIDAVNEFSQYLPPSGRWYKALSVPSKSISLFLRFANSKDVKLPGAERRSVYYRRFGNPNYAGMNGILTNSYRRRLRGSRQETSSSTAGSLRHVRILPSDFAEVIAHTYEDIDSDASFQPQQQNSRSLAPFNFRGAQTPTDQALSTSGPPLRQLVGYDDVPQIDEEDEGAVRRRVRTGSRREAVDFPTPRTSHHPHKWPRRDRGPAPLRWPENSPPRSAGSNLFAGDTSRTVTGASRSREKSRRSAARRSARGDRQNRSSRALMTITLLPEEDDEDDVDGVVAPAFQYDTGLRTENGACRGLVEEEEDTALQTRRLLASMTMIADAEEQELSDRRNGSMSHRLGISGAHGKQSLHAAHQHRGTGRNVWQRLG